MLCYQLLYMLKLSRSLVTCMLMQCRLSTRKHSPTGFKIKSIQGSVLFGSVVNSLMWLMEGQIVEL